jgi:predicted RNA-binding Zn-ribbon protein involved in translation (DUF1610 family)
MKIIDRMHGEAVCPRCGTEGEWQFLDIAEARVEFTCPECGCYEMPRAEFDVEVADISEVNEPR